MRTSRQSFMDQWLNARGLKSPAVPVPREPRLTWQRALRLVGSGQALTPGLAATRGSPHREAAAERLSSAIERARRESRLLALLYVDLDKFKGVNDTFGHSASDELLRAVAHRVRNGLRFTDGVGSGTGPSARAGEVARLCGDEFTVVLPDLRSCRDAAPVAERLIDKIRRPMRIGRSWVAVMPSVGIAIYPKDGTDAETLLRNADAAMYFAKGSRPGTCSFFTPAMSDVALRASDRSPFTRPNSV